MKFQVKALVAATALAGLSAQASASSDLIFYVYDTTSSTSFMYDLGMQSFNANTDVINPLNITSTTAGSAWQQFIASDASWMTNAKWGVAQSVGTGSQVGSTITIGAASTASSPVSAATQVTTLIQAANLSGAGVTAFGSGSGFDNAVVTFVNPQGVDNLGNNSWSAGNTIASVAKPDLTNTALWKQANAAGRGVSYTTFTPSNSNGFAFNGTSLQYNVNVAAVPEPESYAMLVAGLLMLGTVARRRLG